MRISDRDTSNLLNPSVVLISNFAPELDINGMANFEITTLGAKLASPAPAAKNYAW
jgi:hypothetical protein